MAILKADIKIYKKIKGLSIILFFDNKRELVSYSYAESDTMKGKIVIFDVKTFNLEVKLISQNDEVHY